MPDTLLGAVDMAVDKTKIIAPVRRKQRADQTNEYVYLFPGKETEALEE